ncbi:MAG: SusC/RagA family TonB-linked outer membrane protein [Candidatus Pseudobacter hemicellulosilyticus]|uniref:SusC/RagA family TonB-linked outer membrane protein n=1 Tax=Candidatus Pseudobacter hemicellulosilyticus TaxID=3121375 RepID=A0AAJ6BHS9_9BACT|nr:MAG: SusC/RagA family TonB-linked outer membrane protein [Pseudobacter sp.]
MRKSLRFLVTTVLLACLPVLLWAQVTVTGTVKDNSQTPIPGASVRLVNSNLGSSTDASGKFSLNIPGSSGTLEITAIGFRSYRVSVSASNAVVTAVLQEDIGRLDEVVVTGLATSVKRRNLANAVATISNKELTGTAPAQTFDAALSGKIPGALINANSGAPGGGISVKLRGVTSVFGNTQPLYVVDGVFVDNSSTAGGLNSVTGAAAGGNASNQDNPSSRIADLRPDDIENIEILKGASAAAIYGSKAAAGVVLITTRRGKSGKTRISVSQDLGFVKVRKLLGVRQFTEATAADLGGSASSTNPDVIARRESLRQQFIAARDAGQLYDYEKEMFGETGFTRNTALSITGGSDRTSFFFSAAQRDEEGIVERTGYRSNSLRLNVDHRFNENVRLGVSTSYINSSADRGLTNNDNNSVTFGVALATTPGFAQLHRNALGNYPDNPFSSSNPLQTRDLMSNNETVNRFLTGITLDAIFQRSDISTTRLVARGGFDFYDLKTFALFPSELQFQNINQGTAANGVARNLNSNIILSLVNNLTLSDNFALTSSAGLTQENGDYDNILGVTTKLVTGQSNIDQGSGLTASQTRRKYQDNGLFIQEEATLFDAITLTAGLRLDKSTNNGDVSKYYVYPKAGFSWNLTSLGLTNNGFFDNLKLRAAYGEAGNFPVFGSKFTTMSIVNTGGNTGLLVNILRGSKDIAPERTSELEAGLDFGFLDGRLNFEFSVYEKKINDFLLQRPSPGSSGFANQWLNAGDLRNRGIELSMQAQPIATKNVRWTSNTSFWLNRSRITRLVIPPVMLGAFGSTLGSYRIEEGRSATQIVGIDGDNGLVVLGDNEPRFQMNFYNEVVFLQHFSFRFLLHWKQKGYNINLSQFLNDIGGTSPDYDEVDKDGERKGPARLAASTARIFVQEAGYLRLREVGLYYTFPVMPASFIKGLRIGVSANNLFVKTDYQGYDPEVSNFGTGFSTSVDVMPFPASKRGSFHLTIDF